MTAYTHDTELRHLQAKDLYELSIILDDNDGWIRLLENIPKRLNNQNVNNDSIVKALAEYGPKYNNDHIRIILDACKAPGQMKSQLLLEEWSISGRKHERPTLKVLLLLLIKVELFRAADFVSINLLKDLPPIRPNKGLAAPINTTLPSEIFGDIEEILNDDCILYPSTGALQQQQQLNNVLDNNKDYFVKYHELIEKQVPATPNENNPPKPPPRRHGKLQKQHRQQQQQQQQSQHEGEQQQRRDVQSQITNSQIVGNQIDFLPPPENNLIIGTIHQNSSNVNSISPFLTDNSLPNLSILNKDDSEMPMEMPSEKVATNGHLQLNSKISMNKTIENESANNQKKTEHEVNNDCVPRLSVLLNSCATITNSHCNGNDDANDTDHNDIDMTNLKKIPIKKEKGEATNVLKLSSLLESNNRTESNYVNSNEMPELNSLVCDYKNVTIQENHKAESACNIVSTKNENNIEEIELNATTKNLLLCKLLMSTGQIADAEMSTVTLETANGNGINHLKCDNINHDAVDDVSDNVDDDNDNDNGDVDDADNVDDDEDNSMPNLSIFDQNSSIYDSSLTNVTGTSGDLSLDSSVASLDNVPNLSELKH